MALFNLSSPPNFGSYSSPYIRSSISLLRVHNFTSSSIRNRISVTKCELNESSSSRLEIGSPIIVIESPQLLKTAASVPCLRANTGLVKPGDVGRIVSRKPKDVWAVRLSIGTYLIDRKYFKPLELDE